MQLNNRMKRRKKKYCFEWSESFKRRDDAKGILRGKNGKKKKKKKNQTVHTKHNTVAMTAVTRKGKRDLG